MVKDFESIIEDTVAIKDSLVGITDNLEFIGKYLRYHPLAEELAEVITTREVWRLYGEVTNLILAVADKLEELEELEEDSDE